MVRLQHLFLSPMVVLAIPPPALLNQNFAVMMVVGFSGLAGMLFSRRTLVAATSLVLVSLLILGKAASNFFKMGSPDTSVLLVEFTAVIVFMEAGLAVSAFTDSCSKLKGSEDDLSEALRNLQVSWIRRQLVGQGQLGLIVLVLSIALLPIAGLTSISSNQIFFSATLALVAVVVLVFLITHGREPQTG